MQNELSMQLINESAHPSESVSINECVLPVIVEKECCYDFSGE